MKEIGAIFVVSISEIRTVQLVAIKRCYTMYFVVFVSQNLWKILSLLDSHGLSGCFNEHTWSS